LIAKNTSIIKEHPTVFIYIKPLECQVDKSQPAEVFIKWLPSENTESIPECFQDKTEMDDLMASLSFVVKQKVNSIRNLKHLESMTFIARKLRDQYMSCTTGVPVVVSEGENLLVSNDPNMIAPTVPAPKVYTIADFANNFDAGLTKTQKQNFVDQINKYRNWKGYEEIVENLIDNKVMIKHKPVSTTRPAATTTGGSFDYKTNSIEVDLSNTKNDPAYVEELFHAFQFHHYGYGVYKTLRETTFLEVEARLYRAILWKKNQTVMGFQRDMVLIPDELVAGSLYLIHDIKSGPFVITATGTRIGTSQNMDNILKYIANPNDAQADNRKHKIHDMFMGGLHQTLLIEERYNLKVPPIREFDKIDLFFLKINIDGNLPKPVGLAENVMPAMEVLEPTDDPYFEPDGKKNELWAWEEIFIN